MTDQKTHRRAIIRIGRESIDVVAPFDERALQAVWEL